MMIKARVLPVMNIAILLFVCVCAVSLVSNAYAEFIPGREKRIATVRIIPVDILGNEVKGVDVELFQLRNEGTNFAKRFHRGMASKILYGTYTARIHVSGYRFADRIVRVFQPNVVVVIGLQVASEGAETTWDIAGRVHGGAKSGGPFWIRVSGIYSDIILDAELDGSGNFSLENVPEGPYVLSVVQGGKILDVRTIKVPLESPLMIEIGESKPVTSKSDGKTN